MSEKKAFSNIEQVIDYLYFKRPHGQVKLGMQRIEHMVQRLGNPHLGYKTIHVAGTNGKGSVTRTISTILSEAGFKVGSNYSPHLIKFNERITINNENIPDGDIVEVMNRLHPVIEEMDAMNDEMKPSFFEIITAMAFEYFKMKKVDVAVIEVGLGGRFDATSVVQPQVCVISNVGFDHMKTLGDTLAKIAFEKSGIIKKSIPTVTGSEEPEALEVITRRCSEESSELFVLGKDFGYEPLEIKMGENVFSYHDEEMKLDRLELNLNGLHQFKNCSVSLRAYGEFCRKNNMRFDEKAVRAALKKVYWAGRFEKIIDYPMVIIDGAHNMQGIDALVENWNRYFEGVKPVLLTGMLSDKEFNPMIGKLAGISEHVVVTEPEAPRETDSGLIVDTYKKYLPEDSVFYFKDREEACKKAKELSEEFDAPILITGSLYVVGYLKEIFLEMK